VNYPPFYGIGGDFGIASTGSLNYIPVPESAVLAPSDMIAIGDYPELDPSHGQYNDGDIGIDEPADYVSNRHSGGGNVLFLDGHVEYNSQSNWIMPDDGHRKRWNRDNLPHP
jgi:prepilin-type processing-associated H-X9-DG protein